MSSAGVAGLLRGASVSPQLCRVSGLWTSAIVTSSPLVREPGDHAHRIEAWTEVRKAGRRFND
jgi:hypothetical protein